MWSQRSLVWWDRFTARRAAWRRSCGGWPSPGALLHRSVLGGAVVQPDDRRLKGVREGRSSQRDFTADDASSSMVAVCGSTTPAAGSRCPAPNFFAKKACRPGAVPGAVGHGSLPSSQSRRSTWPSKQPSTTAVLRAARRPPPPPRKLGWIKRWRRSGNASYFDARRSPPTLTVSRSRRRAHSLRTDLRRRRGPPMAHCRFRVTQRRQQPQWARRAIAGVRGRTNNVAATTTVHRPPCTVWSGDGGSSGQQ